MQILTAKYLRHENFMLVRVKSTESHVWKGILKSRSVIDKGQGISITNGHKTKFWIDNWLYYGPLFNHQLKPYLI